ncbi:uncharacterized protein PHALS_13161 [Plasmopara halstedii]|uniref:Uncharacterized protein n=1 Tax=Plasmopara halstedii TaxID=4781 RepID=A0A0P1ANY2_PLAHL|nr:uncharacterized protein PHALS_13161 [Plasmopara halstedii]CEG42926.1 hypothetical protein PHALS_13161 [Plasmopara halstedii]|eukprot:XP_024579295.1 hypothetical protein PHALS_13161 [Plasmopara halstedii]
MCISNGVCVTPSTAWRGHMRIADFVEQTDWQMAFAFSRDGMCVNFMLFKTPLS